MWWGRGRRYPGEFYTEDCATLVRSSSHLDWTRSREYISPIKGGIQTHILIFSHWNLDGCSVMSHTAFFTQCIVYSDTKTPGSIGGCCLKVSNSTNLRTEWMLISAAFGSFLSFNPIVLVSEKENGH